MDAEIMSCSDMPDIFAYSCFIQDFPFDPDITARAGSRSFSFEVTFGEIIDNLRFE